jgi:hypothetical protein
MMEQLEKDARTIATHILQSDGNQAAPASRLFEDLAALAKAVLTSSAGSGWPCEDELAR